MRGKRRLQPPTMNFNPLNLRPFEQSDFKLLRKLDSPIYRRTRELVIKGAKSPATPVTVEERAELVFQFTGPIARARRELKCGRNNFRAVAVQAVAGMAEADLAQALATIEQQFAAALDGGPKRNGETKP